MDFALVYLIERFLYQFFNFFRHWYLDASREFLVMFRSAAESLEHRAAFRVTLEHFFEPLYQDFTFLGRILGVFFRSGRLLLGSVLYLMLTALFLLLYLGWLSIPPLIILYGLGLI